MKYPNIPKGAEVGIIEENYCNFYGGPWTRVEWNGNWYIKVEGKSGVVTYGELKQPSIVNVGDKVRAGKVIGHVTPVLRPEKYRPDIRNHSVAMLHVELRKETCHLDGWKLDGERDKRLLDPTPYLKSKDIRR